MCYGSKQMKGMHRIAGGNHGELGFWKIFRWSQLSHWSLERLLLGVCWLAGWGNPSCWDTSSLAP